MSTEEAQGTGYKNIRVEGLGRIFKPRWKRKDGSYYESPKWWISFYHRGKEIRESSESENEAEAKRLLKRKVTAIEAGRVLPREDKLTFDELAKDIENDYKVNAKRTLADLSYRIGHLSAQGDVDLDSNGLRWIRSSRVRSIEVSKLKTLYLLG